MFPSRTIKALKNILTKPLYVIKNRVINFVINQIGNGANDINVKPPLVGDKKTKFISRNSRTFEYSTVH